MLPSMAASPIPRRSFLASGAALALGAGAARVSTSGQRTTTGTRVLLKGGSVLSMDPRVGNFREADVLIEGSKIAAVQPNLNATAETIDASNMIVMPGFEIGRAHV